MKDEEVLDYTAYAELVVKTGVSLKKGQSLVIRTEYPNYPFARRLAQIAYAQGARVVDIQITDDFVTKARLAAQSEDEGMLSSVPRWFDAWQKEMVEDGWAYIALEGVEDQGTLADSDQQAMQTLQKASVNAKKDFRAAVLDHRIPWCVVTVPGPRWAVQVLGEGKSTRDLWETLKPILRLNHDDPAEAWRFHSQELEERGKRLAALNLDAIRILDNGTDLTLGLNPDSLWIGGGARSKDGTPFLPNIPTEEVFTTPDYRRAEGRVRVTRPVEIRGTVIKGMNFRFEAGVLVDFSAEEGYEALKAFVETDEGSKRLGEVALVGADSPIAQSGLLFGSILYDENASCHIALGEGYSVCLPGGEDLGSPEDKLIAGCNVSMVHRDFMIGSPKTEVIGMTKDGKDIQILLEGRFVL